MKYETIKLLEDNIRKKSSGPKPWAIALRQVTHNLQPHEGPQARQTGLPHYCHTDLEANKITVATTDNRASQVAQWQKIDLPMQETQVRSLDGEDPLE